MDENLEELYDNLADPDDEEYYDSEDDEVEYEEYDEEDNIAEDPGDDEDWWHSGEDDVNEVILEDTSDTNDSTNIDFDSVAETTFEPIETVTYDQTTEIESATTGRELFDAIADLLEYYFNVKTSKRLPCNISFITKSEFDEVPDEDKYLPENADWYEQTGDDDDDDSIDLSGDEKVPNVYFIVDAYD